jgi:DNA mismatch repair protein MutS2
MSHSALETLEYQELLALVASYAGSPLGRNAMIALTPGDAADAVDWRLQLAGEAIEYRRELAAPTRGGADGAQLQAVSFGGIEEPGEALRLIGVEGTALETPQIIALLRLLEVAVKVRSALVGARRKYAGLAREAERIGDFEPLVRQWAGKFLPSGELDDRASAALQRIRQDLEKQRRVILSSLRHMLRQLNGEDSSGGGDEIITVRGDRFVVPVRAAKKSQVRGVVHGSSSSGQTLYVEPIDAIEGNNDLVRLREEEAREVHRILREITASFHARAAEIGEATEILARLDQAFAAARFAIDYHGVIPQFCEALSPQRFLLQAARHPLLESLLRRQPGAEMRAPVALSLTLDEAGHLLVISGPNTGGKTVAMKTAGLLALMALSGLPVPAERVELPRFDQVLADIGDAQSITENLSTFSSHLLNIKRMLESVTPASLILLDELGGATDPEEGGALAVAVIERFRALGVFGITSTHHMALKAYAASTTGIQSGSMGFNEETLAPTYKLMLGRPGNSSGLAIAQRLGLPADVLARAREALSSSHHDIGRFLNQLEADAEAAAALRLDLEKRAAEMAERERAWNDSQSKRETERAAAWEKHLDALTRELQTAMETKLREVASLAAAGAGGARAAKPADMEKKASRAASQLRGMGIEGLRQAWVSHLSGEGPEDPIVDEEAARRNAEFARLGGADNRPVPRAPVAPRQAAVGDRVHLKSLGRTGLVRGKGNDWLEVEIGPLRTRVAVSDVAEVFPAGLQAGVSASGAGPLADARGPAINSARGGAGVSVKMEQPSQNSLSEINVIGETADDALARVDKFLDNALLASLTRVRIVHGSGMGVLKRAIAQMLSTHPQVARHTQAPQGEGGAGATIVELKQ